MDWKNYRSQQNTHAHLTGRCVDVSVKMLMARLMLNKTFCEIFNVVRLPEIDNGTFVLTNTEYTKPLYFFARTIQAFAFMQKGVLLQLNYSPWILGSRFIQMSCVLRTEMPKIKNFHMENSSPRKTINCWHSQSVNTICSSKGAKILFRSDALVIVSVHLIISSFSKHVLFYGF